jgi:hypothetical protein
MWMAVNVLGYFTKRVREPRNLIVTIFVFTLKQMMLMKIFHSRIIIQTERCGDRMLEICESCALVAQHLALQSEHEMIDQCCQFVH